MVEHGGHQLIQISLCLSSECWDFQHYHVHKKRVYKMICFYLCMCVHMHMCVMCVHTGAHRGQKTGVRGG